MSHKVLFYTDFSAGADQAFSCAVAQARHAGADTLHLLHVIPEPDAQFWKSYIRDVAGVNHKARRDIDAKIQAAYTCKMPPDMRLDIAITIGAEADEILKHAAAIHADLLVMGRQAYGPMKRVLYGNAVLKVARKADCAVLVVPFDAKESICQTAE